MKQRNVENLEIDGDLRARLDVFADLLLRWNAKINLVSQRDAPMLWPRHIQDSLQLIGYLPTDCHRAIDLGSGAGFPGLVVALASRIPFTLVEADSRKAAFLREAARITEAPVVVHNARADDTSLKPAMLITARALANLPQLLCWAYPLMARGATCLFLKGKGVHAEIVQTRAQRRWECEIELLPSKTDPAATILKVSDLRYRQPHATIP